MGLLERLDEICPSNENVIVSGCEALDALKLMVSHRDCSIDDVYRITTPKGLHEVEGAYIGVLWIENYTFDMNDDLKKLTTGTVPVWLYFKSVPVDLSMEIKELFKYQVQIFDDKVCGIITKQV